MPAHCARRVGREVLAFAAVALCMLNRDGVEPTPNFGSPSLCWMQWPAQKHPAAEQLLARLAKDGRNTRIRMESARRLGIVADSHDVRALLHEYAQNGFRPVNKLPV